MKIQTIITFGLLFVLFACRQNANEDLKKKILGEWTEVAEVPIKQPIDSTSTIPPPPPPVGGNVKWGYIFQENGVCEAKLGYFIRVKGDRFQDGGRKFLGTKTKYKIVDDSLKIFNLRDSTWTTMKIYRITKDTLTLQTRGETLVHYCKPHYKPAKVYDYEQIIVSTSGCFGSCPVSNTVITNTGKVIYSGESFSQRNGYFKAQIDRREFTEIEENFNKSDIENLKNVYDYPVTDNETITVTFIKNGSIFKTISDYAHYAPTEFFWAYMPVIYLYQRIEMDSIPDIPDYLQIRWLRFESRGKTCQLAQSESFYLWNLLLSANKTDKTFKPEYSLHFSGIDDLSKIITDGQYYKFEMKNKRQVTLDLGFNFITKNVLIGKFIQ